MKKILLFARDPGGANTIIPLVGPLLKRGYRVFVYAKDVALIKFATNEIKAKDIVPEIGEVTIKNIRRFLNVHQPDFIITGTSADDMTEKYLWRVAESINIPTFAVLDQWINYGIRFSQYGVSEMEEYEKNKKHEYLPTKILVMDSLAKKEAVKAGLPKEKLLISGQPYFEFLKHKKFNISNLKKIKEKYKIKKNDFIVVFASEPICKTYGEAINSKHYWGYDEIAIFKHLFESLILAAGQTDKKIRLIVKLHPKETDEYYTNLISLLKQDIIKVNLDRESDPQEMIKIANMVCGMSSMFLLESYIMDKPTISIQIGLNRENPFVLDRIGLIKSILIQKQLNQGISEIISGKKQKAADFKLVQNPVKRIIEYMETILCQS